MGLITTPGVQLPRRIGVFGGAFDPPHNAHLALAQAAVAQLQLNELRIIPTGQAWHKPRALTAAAHRLAMARLAFAVVPGALVDDCELQRDGPSFTIDTLRALSAAQPAAQIYLLMGEDQALALPSWHDWRAIMQIAIISVAKRPDSKRANAGFDAESLQKTASDEPAALATPSRFTTLHLPAMPVSATDIRARVAAGLGVAHLVPAAVARYIDSHHLYLTT